MATNIDRQSKKPQKTVIQDITLVSPNREQKDMSALKSAIVRAESITVPSRNQIYDIYHDITTIDGHLSGILQKRSDAITNKTIRYIGKDKRKVDEFDDLINSLKFNNLMKLIIEKVYWGLSGVEFIVGEEFDYNVIPRKHIRIEQNMIVKSQYDYTGTSFDELPFVWVIGEKNDLGRLLQCSMYALYKRGGFGDLAQYVEIFGQPVRIIYYDAYDTKTKEELRKILNESGSSLAMMIPKQAQFEMMDGKTSNGNGDLQEKFIRICNEEMSIAILGNSETTASSSSSGYAQAKEHGKQQLEITKSDLKLVQNILNDKKFISILKSYGYPVQEGGKFEFEQEIDLAELKLKLEIDAVVSGKVPVADDYWYETYGIPKPDNYDELKAKQEEDRQAIKMSKNGTTNNEDPEDEEDKKGKDPKSNSKADMKKGKLFQPLLDLLSFFHLAPRQSSEGALEW